MTEKLKVANRSLFYGDVGNYKMLDPYDQTQVFQAGPAIIHSADYLQAEALSALNKPNVFISVAVQLPNNIVGGKVKPLTTFGKSV